MDAHLEVNGALLTFSNAALLLQAQADTALNLQVIKGTVDVAASGESLAVKAGSAASVALTGTQVSAAPQPVDNYSFSALTSAPLTLLPQEALSCVAGGSSGSAALYRTPGASQSSAELSADNGALVTGQTKTSDGKIWYLIGSNWVSADDVADWLVTVRRYRKSRLRRRSSQFRSLPPASPTISFPTGARSGRRTPALIICLASAPRRRLPSAIIWRRSRASRTGRSPGWVRNPRRIPCAPAETTASVISGRNQLNNANLSLTVTFTSADDLGWDDEHRL